MLTQFHRCREGIYIASLVVKLEQRGQLSFNVANSVPPAINEFSNDGESVDAVRIDGDPDTNYTIRSKMRGDGEPQAGAGFQNDDGTGRFHPGPRLTVEFNNQVHVVNPATVFSGNYGYSKSQASGFYGGSEIVVRGQQEITFRFLSPNQIQSGPTGARAVFALESGAYPAWLGAGFIGQWAQLLLWTECSDCGIVPEPDFPDSLDDP